MDEIWLNGRHALWRAYGSLTRVSIL